jgi:hypothetical protein
VPMLRSYRIVGGEITEEPVGRLRR